MFIRNEDHPLLEEFLRREAADFRYKDGPEYGQRRYVDRFLYLIKEKLTPISSANFVEIQSLTNLGQKERALVLTPEPWSSKGRVILMLPCVPTGGVGVSIRD